jgi:ABC-type multidrug transport system ATPase subunit
LFGLLGPNGAGKTINQDPTTLLVHQRESLRFDVAKDPEKVRLLINMVWRGDSGLWFVDGPR